MCVKGLIFMCVKPECKLFWKQEDPNTLQQFSQLLAVVAMK